MIRVAALSVARSVTAGRRASWVFGLEAQGDWANLRTERVFVNTPLLDTTNTWKSQSMGSASSRVRLVTPGMHHCFM